MTPLVIREVEGTVYAIFPSEAASAPYLYCVYTVGKGLHEMPTSFFNDGKHIPFEYRIQLIQVMGNVGISNLKYYSDIRNWMHRDKRVKEDGIRDRR